MARKRADGGEKKNRRAKLAQIRQTWQLTKRVDRKLPLVTAAWFLGVFLVFLALGFLLDQPWFFGFLGLLSGLLAATVVFGRRAERAAYSQIEGQPGAAAAVLRSLRRGWTVTEGVAVTPTRDIRQAAMVHRATGRPGVVLVAEGPPSRAAQLIAQERKRLGRVVPDVPVYDVQVGGASGQVPIGKLQRHLVKLPRNIRPAQVAEVERRLKSLGQSSLPLPKGPLPKGARMPRPPKGAPGAR